MNCLIAKLSVIVAGCCTWRMKNSAGDFVVEGNFVFKFYFLNQETVPLSTQPVEGLNRFKIIK